MYCEPSGGGGSGNPGGGENPGNPGEGENDPGSGGGTGGGSSCPFTGAAWYNLIPPEYPCGPSQPPSPPVPYIVELLKNILNLNQAQVSWLTQNINRANEIYSYLEKSNSVAQIANDHLTKMMEDNNYLLFVISHAQTGNTLKMWWEDDVWLRYIHYSMSEDIFNFYMDIKTPENSKPIEFADKCSGIPVMIQASAVDKRERSGYITVDGKFIYSSYVGTTGDLNVGLRIKNGRAYYNYKMSLGAPTQTYYGMIINADRQEYWIPVNTNVHLHVPDFGNNGYSINTDPHVSNDDEKIADLIQKNLYTFNFYVTEIKDNGKFLTASFSNNSNYYQIEGDDLLLADVCSLVN